MSAVAFQDLPPADRGRERDGGARLAGATTGAPTTRLLALEDEDEFVRETTAALGPQPPNFHAIVALNAVRSPIPGALCNPAVRAGFGTKLAWVAARDQRTGVAWLHDRVDELVVLDVREAGEWRQGHIAGAVHTPYHDIHAIPDGIDPAQAIAVICSSGQRSLRTVDPRARASPRRPRAGASTRPE